MSSTLNPPALSVLERLVLIVQGMRQAVAARGGRDRVNTALIVLAWGRLHRMITRFEALVTLVRAGRLPHPPHAVARTRPPRPLPRRPSDRLPSGFAWLLRLVPESAGYGSQLQHLLTDPETLALFRAAPQAGRILRPLCRMLGVEPGAARLLPPPRPTPASSPPGQKSIEVRCAAAPAPKQPRPANPDRTGLRPPPQQRR